MTTKDYTFTGMIPHKRIDYTQYTLSRLHPEWIPVDNPDHLVVAVEEHEDGTKTVTLTVPEAASDAEIQTVIQGDWQNWMPPVNPARTKVIGMTQSAVGVTLDALTAAQVRALLACVLYKAGAIDPATLAIEPLAEWL